MSERIRYAWGSSSLGNFIAVASDRGLVAFEFGEQGTAMLDALQVRFPEATIEGDANGLSDTVGKLEHLVDHPYHDPRIALDMRGNLRMVPSQLPQLGNIVGVVEKAHVED